MRTELSNQNRGYALAIQLACEQVGSLTIGRSHQLSDMIETLTDKNDYDHVYV